MLVGKVVHLDTESHIVDALLMTMYGFRIALRTRDLDLLLNEVFLVLENVDDGLLNRLKRHFLHLTAVA